MGGNVPRGVLEDFSTRGCPVEMTRGLARPEWSGTKSGSGGLKCGKPRFRKWHLPRLNA